MLPKIAKMPIATLTAFNPLIASQHPFTCFLEGHNPISWDLSNMPTNNVIMGLYAHLQFMSAHFMLTFKEAFLTGFFEGQSQIIGPLNPAHHVRWVAYTNQELHIKLPTLLHTLEQINSQQELELALQRHP